MGLRGPKPKSAKLESDQGFPGRRKAKTKAVSAAAKDMQQPAENSGFVPPEPPAQIWRKGAREVWRELTANPATAFWFKRSDHNLIARYCSLEADFRALSKKMPPISIMTTTTAGDQMPKRNPDHRALLELSRELRALEAQIGGSPLSRLNLAAKIGLTTDPTLAKAKDAPRLEPPSDTAAEQRQTPIGILKSATPPTDTKLN